MKAIVCDHVRRWWWLWLGSCIVCVGLVGVGQPLKPDLSNAWFFPLAMYLGVVQLSQDLRSGSPVPNVLRALPVTAREVGRAWWWSSVGLPALTLAGITALVFLFLSCIIHRPVSGLACFIYALTNALLFGPLFFFFTGTPAAGSIAPAGTRLRGFIFSILFVASFLGLLYFYRLFPPLTVRWEIFVVVATVLTIAGWFRAEAFAQERLGSLVSNTNRLHAAALVGKVVNKNMDAISRLFGGRSLSSRCAEGPGGLRLLFQTIFYPMFGLGLFMVVGAGLLLYKPLSSGEDAGFAGIFWSVFSLFLWFANVLVIPRAMMQFRWLRTLPVTATQLAGVYLFAPVTAMLAFMSLGNLILGIIYPIPQMSFLSMLHQGCLLQIALTTVMVPLILWRGLDALMLAVILGLMTSCGVSSFFIQKYVSLTTILIVAPLIVLVSFLLTLRLWNVVSGPCHARPEQIRLFWLAER